MKLNNTWSFLYPAVIIAAAFLVFLNTLANGFVFDDTVQVLDNQWIRDVKYLPAIFTKGSWNYFGMESNYYRPMMHVVYMLNYCVFGLNALGFHLVNIVLHAGVCVLLFLTALRLLQQFMPSLQNRHIPAFAAAMVFAAHPVHTEAVSWVAGVPDLSSSLFYLLSLYLYMRASRGNMFAGAYAASVASFLIACFCKEPAVTLPAMLAAYDYLAGGRSRLRENIKKYIPFLAVLAIYITARFFALGEFAPVKGNGGLSMSQGILTVLLLLKEYILKTAFPIDLNVYHIVQPAGPNHIVEAIDIAFSAAMLIVLIVAVRKHKFFAFCLILFLVPLLPALYLPGLGKIIFSERYLYLPSAGLALGFSLWVARAMDNGRKPLLIMQAIIIAGMVAAFSFATVDRNLVWASDYTLWSDTVKKSPDAAVPHDALGTALFMQGRMDEAAAEYKTAIALQPGFARAHANLGNVYNKSGDIDDALAQYKEALKLKPDDANTYNNLGIIYGKTGRLDEAVKQFRQAVGLKPFYADAHNNLGLAYKKKGWMDRAAQEFREAVRLKPENDLYRGNLAAVSPGQLR